MTTCPVCESEADGAEAKSFEGKVITCALCGVYRVTFVAIGMLATKMRDQRFEILARAQYEATSGDLPEINSSLF